MGFTPHDAGLDCLKRARATLRVSASVPVLQRQDLRRAAVVMGVSALDTYMHRLVLSRVYEHNELPAALKKVQVPLEFALDQADEITRRAKAAPHGRRARVDLKKEIRAQLSYQTFQSSRGVETAFAMAGLKKTWAAVGSALTPPMATDEVKARLDEIVRLRNRIVHEGAYAPLERPRGRGTERLTRSEARAILDFLEALINAVHATT